MPLYKKWDIGQAGTGAIWLVNEDEQFFRDETGLSPDIRNDKRRVEHLASRFLLRHLQHDFPLAAILADEHKKPYLADGSFQLSISHSWPYIAVAIDRSVRMGIDIQTWHPRIGDIKNKFLSQREQAMCEDNLNLFTHAWCAKESVYKWNGKKGVDFIRHLPIESLQQNENEIDITIQFSIPETPVPVKLHNFYTTDFACSYVVGSAE